VLTLLIRNQSEIVDCYKLAVSGFKGAAWWTIEPQGVYLLPFVTGEKFEQRVKLRLHPPRTSAATAKSWPILITADSEAREEQVAVVETALTIEPFDNVVLQADCERAEGRGGARMQLTVANKSNHDLEVEVSGGAKDKGASFRFPTPNPVLIAAGKKVHGDVELHATKPMLVGRPADHELILQAAAAKQPGPGEDDAADDNHKAGDDHNTDQKDYKDWPSLRVVFRQRAWLPWWTSLVAIALLAVVALLAKAYFERVAVPDVRGDEVSSAREEIKAGHLKGIEMLAVPRSRPTGGAKGDGDDGATTPGKVFQEIPRAGAKVAPDSTVALVTAVRSGLAHVPNVKDLSRHAAENRLANVGFAIGEIKPHGAKESWVVVKQEPSAGSLVQRDTTAVNVTLDQVAVVPELIGQDPAKALQMLRSLGLILLSRTPLSPAKVIATQEPAANELVRVGEEVTVTLAAPARKSAAATPKKSPEAKAKPKPAAAAALPALGVASSAPAAAAALTEAGLRTREMLAISPTVPAGHLLRTEPAAGTKLRRGASVTLVVSAGFPQVAVDDGHRVLALNGVTGRRVAVIAGGPTPAVEPSWSPDGREVAYVSGGRVMLIGTQGAAGPRALTPAGDHFAAPTFPSSSSAPAVLAAISDLPNGVQAVCLLALTHGSPSCIPEPGWTLGESISWSPAGTELLVAASRAAASRAVSSPGEVGLLSFTTRKPFSVRARDWRPTGPALGLATPVVNGAGVLAAAFSPDGHRVALVEDLAGFNSVALVTPSDLTLAKVDRLVQLTSVCAVQWRADGAELLVQVGEGKGAGEGQCASSTGALYRVDPAQPGAQSFLARGVSHPSWQPLAGVG
jgi:beta-lactam-binding protein with PASTA domain